MKLTPLILTTLVGSLMLSGCSLNEVGSGFKAGVTNLTNQLGKKSEPETAKTPYRSPQQILNESPKSDWYTLDQNNLVYLTLANDKQVILELNPTFAPAHAAQIKVLAQEKYWDGLSVYRVHDNYVAQFGSFDIRTEKDTKALPAAAQAKLPAEFVLPAHQINLVELKDKDPYSDKIGFVDGFPVAIKDNEAFLVHCYGAVGASRMNALDSSRGNELYVMIGQPARNLDRQITVVGRVVSGIEQLSGLPRGSGIMGFYDEKDGKPMGIKSVRTGSQLPVGEQVQLESIKTDSQTFKELVDSRRNIQSDWHAKGKYSGGMALCDVRQTIRPVK